MDLKENMIPDDKKNRARGENWTQEEKDLFFEIMRDSAPIIENKLTDTNSNKRKNLEWIKIKSKLQELTGIPRETAQLKGFWRRAKLSAKKSVSQHKQALYLHATGAGERPPTPPADDLMIVELCPTDFVVEDDNNDSDTTFQLHSEDNEALYHQKLATKMMEEEHELKMEYQRRELTHQQLRHKLELEILMLEKEKQIKELEIIKRRSH